MALGDIQIDQQTGHRFGAHGCAAIGMQGPHAGLDAVPGHRMRYAECGGCCVDHRIRERDPALLCAPCHSPSHRNQGDTLCRPWTRC